MESSMSLVCIGDKLLRLSRMAPLNLPVPHVLIAAPNIGRSFDRQLLDIFLTTILR